MNSKHFLSRFINSYLFIVIIILFASNTNSFAQQKVAYVDTDSIIRQMPAYLNLDLRFDIHSAIFKEKLEKKQVEFQQYYESVVDTFDRFLLTPLQAEKMYERVKQKQKKLEELTQQVNAEILKKEEELFRPITEKFDKAVAEVAKENGFIYIFNKKYILCINGGIDVTDLVKEKLSIN